MGLSWSYLTEERKKRRSPKEEVNFSSLNRVKFVKITLFYSLWLSYFLEFYFTLVYICKVEFKLLSISSVYLLCSSSCRVKCTFFISVNFWLCFAYFLVMTSQFSLCCLKQWFLKPVSKFWGLQNLSTFQIFLFFCEMTGISFAFAQNQAFVLGCPGIRNSLAPYSCCTYLGSRCHVAWISCNYFESLLLPQLLRGENDSKQSDEIQASYKVHWRF